MRQFIFGLVVAVLGWWGYGEWTSSNQADGSEGPVTVVSTAGNPTANGGAADMLEQLLDSRSDNRSDPGAQAGPPPAEGQPLDARRPGFLCRHRILGQSKSLIAALPPVLESCRSRRLPPPPKW